MKKIVAFFLTVLLLLSHTAPTFAAFGKAVEKSEAEEVVAKPQQSEKLNFETGLTSLSAEQILALTPTSYKELTGQKMTFKEKIALKYVQHSLKKDLKKNGSFNLKDYIDDDGERRFNFGGFALGFFLGLIGVALAHIFSRDKSFRRSSWYGVGALLIIAIIVTAAGGGN